ncbi:4Fe-4S dicluster domain-containing protein [Raoultibacter timonensis]|uniref:4Fe-4S ferredoxin-type domain-containing protein n=1 Tax=Raoultibacter timonensis TaxID=1907662 RepID=A0ABM7WN80_9ACTN|nr:4Fe-4S dicluster domain-containing protein [Raoultibacter timonensis]BDE97867.1 hypothetical protein CE91St30_32000 [Raoultibacter timonensis]BDF52470.1 hypothetical protein CE91St31_32000 [Raoultibacter timonensis]
MAGLSRRGFLVSAGVLAGLVASGDVANALAEDKAVLRPPGAQSEHGFLARCMRCQKCVSVCHARVIQPLSIAESIKGASTPTLDFSRNYCDFCAEENGGRPRCSEVCPTKALLPQSGKATVNGIAVVNERSCIAWDWKGCTVCVDECPQDAIALDEQGRALVDDALCDGCGLCELICPSSSLRSYGGGRSEAKGIVVVAKERERA